MIEKQLIKGLISFVPGINKILAKGTGGTDSAKYCYSVWLRHLVMAKINGLNANPQTVAELGPGDSLGIGIAALISGSEKYFAFDIVKHANAEKNLSVFDGIVDLFHNRTPIPGDDVFPNVKPYLKTYDFPSELLDEKRLSRALEKSRLARIRDSICNPHKSDSKIQYKVPWNQLGGLERGSIDMICSQAVLEHVDDLHNTYKSMALWLKPNGYLSHQIDFKCHGTADEWNGHWTYSDLKWKIIRGRQLYLLNREPHSRHITLLKKEGFRIVCDKKVESTSNLKRNALVSRFRSISSEDLTTSGAFIQAIKL